MERKKYKIDKFEPLADKLQFNFKKVETAGFEPLEVKIKRFSLAGELKKLNVALFDSNDYEEIYSNLNEIESTSPDRFDELEDVVRKYQLVQERKAAIIQRRMSEINTGNVQTPIKNKTEAEVSQKLSTDELENNNIQK